MDIYNTTVLDPDLIRSYLETEYHVLVRLPFILSIGKLSNDLSSLHSAYGVSCSAFITAWNPYSEVTDQATNIERQGQLANELSVAGCTSIPSLGKHPSGNWEGEESLLVLGISLTAAQSIGRSWGQNAILCSGADSIPHLILLR